jgi:hypothetical protein
MKENEKRTEERTKERSIFFPFINIKLADRSEKKTSSSKKVKTKKKK